MRVRTNSLGGNGSNFPGRIELSGNIESRSALVTLI